MNAHILRAALFCCVVFQVAAPARSIHDAARSGDLAAVQRLLDATPALTGAKDEAGQTPLHVAASAGAPSIIQALIERGANVNAVDSRGKVPLHIAAGRGHIAGLTLLLDKGGNPNAEATGGGTPLHEAVMGRHVEAIRLLAARQANLELTDGMGRTPLVVAAREMRGAAVVTALLDRGAKIDAADKYGDTALLLAAWRGSADVVGLLLGRGAALPTDASQRQELLLNAVSTGLADLFMKLLESGIDLPNPPAPARTLLHRAAEGGSVSIVAALVERRFDVRRADANGWTPLHFAADLGRTPVMSFLLEKGADPNARTAMGQTAYNLAQDNDDGTTVSWLAARRVDPAPARFPDLRGPYLGQKPPGRTPEVFAPGIVSARFGLHSTIVFSPDGREAFWALMVPPRSEGYGGGRTLVTRLVDGRWSYPRRAVFDGIALDDVPFYHPDGLKLYDMSDRPMPGGGEAEKENIWVWQKDRAGWTAPRPVAAAVNRLPHHWQFSLDRTGTLYFGSTWAGSRGIFCSRLVDGAYAEPVSLEAVLGPQAQFPFVAPDGRYLLFTRQQQLYVSFREGNGQWAAPVGLGPAFRGMLPIVSPDGKYLFFRRDSQAYWVDASVIDEARAPRGGTSGSEEQARRSAGSE